MAGCVLRRTIETPNYEILISKRRKKHLTTTYKLILKSMAWCPPINYKQS